MSRTVRTRLRAGFLGVAFAASVLAVPGAASAADPAEQSVDLTIEGGDATALAGCINIALEDEARHDHAKKGDRHDKRDYRDWRRSKIRQINKCKNEVKAEAGSVTLKNVDFIVTQEGDKDTKYQSVTVTISGGDALALAACANVLLDGDASVRQENECKNSAVAEGGDVTLENVTIDVFQG